MDSSTACAHPRSGAWRVCLLPLAVVFFAISATFHVSEAGSYSASAGSLYAEPSKRHYINFLRSSRHYINFARPALKAALDASHRTKAESAAQSLSDAAESLRFFGGSGGFDPSSAAGPNSSEPPENEALLAWLNDYIRQRLAEEDAAGGDTPPHPLSTGSTPAAVTQRPTLDAEGSKSTEGADDDYDESEETEQYLRLAGGLGTAFRPGHGYRMSTGKRPRGLVGSMFGNFFASHGRRRRQLG